MLRRKLLQNHFRQSFESSPESRGSQPSISLKHGRLAHVRSQFSLFRRSPTHKNLPPATFCTSERVFAVLFARRKKYQSVPSQGVSRFCKPRISAPKQQLPTNKIKSFENFYILFVRHKKYDKKSLPAGSFEVFQTSNQRTKTSTSHRQN